MNRWRAIITLAALALLVGCSAPSWTSEADEPQDAATGPTATPDYNDDIESDTSAGQDIDQFPAAVLDEAVALAAKGQYDQAEDLLTPAIGAHNNSHDHEGLGQAFFWRGYCREHTGRVNAASLDYETVITRFPETPAATHAADRLSILAR